MNVPNITLAYLVAELKPLVEGSILRRVQELENNWFKFKLHTRQGTKDLIVTPQAFFVTSYSIPAKRQSSGFGGFLRKRLANKKVLSLKQHFLDRIVLLEFDSNFLVLELFAKGNVVLTNRDMEIVSAYRRERWRDRNISKGSPYRFPSSKGLNPLSVSAGKLKQIFSDSGLDCIRALLSALNIAPVVGEEACLGAGVEKSKPARELTEAELKGLLSELKKLYSIDLKRVKAVVASGQILPFEMRSAHPVESRFGSLNEAFDEVFSAEFLKQTRSTQGNEKLLRLKRGLEQQLASRDSLERAIAEARAKGEAIYGNYNVLQEALGLAKEFAMGKKTKKEIMYKLASLGIGVKRIDLNHKKITLNLGGVED